MLDFKFFVFVVIIMYASFGETWHNYVFPVSFVYMLFYLVYAVKHIDVDKYFGDVSYGVYIYAWPIQQLVANTFNDFNPVHNTIISSIIVIILAYLSWIYIEKPALSLKGKLLKRF